MIFAPKHHAPFRFGTALWRLLGATFALCLAFGHAPASAEVPAWVAEVESNSPLRDIFFRPIDLPRGAVLARRPPRETRAALSALLEGDPSDAGLYILRAREAERQLDFYAAESDWRRFAEATPDRVRGQRELADFYRRRLRPAAEVDALAVLAGRPAQEQDHKLPSESQVSWQSFERIFEVIEAHALPAALAERQYRAWVQRYPTEPAVYERFHRFLLEEARFDEVERLIADYREVFPRDEVFPVRAKAALLRRSRSADELFGFYKEAFEPLWPFELIRDYFAALEQEMPPQVIGERLTAATRDSPADLRAAAKAFYYHQRQADLEAAQQVVLNFQEHKQVAGSCLSSDELFTVGTLLARIRHQDQAAPYFLAAYLLAGALDERKHDSLAGLLDSVVSALPASRAVAAGADPFEIGIEQLLDAADFHEKASGFTSCQGAGGPPSEAAAAAESAPPRSLRGLMAELAEKFPRSPKRPELHLRVLEISAARFVPEHTIRLGEEFLASFGEASLRARAALALGEAYTRIGFAEAERSLYDRLLQEFSDDGAGVPLGESAPGGARSPAYALVIERYVSRLEAEGDTTGVAALYEREIERNPGDPGIYRAFIGYLHRQRLAGEVERVYLKAIRQFDEGRWYTELAHWYLRQQNAAAFQRISGEAVGVLPAREVETYFDELGGVERVGPAAYAQLNLQAHRRFPFHLTYIRNLLSAYAQEPTRDADAWERILRQYWFHDDELRSLFFDFLSKTGRLQAEAEQIRSSIPAAATSRWQQMVRDNSAAAQFLAEAEVSQSRFESAVPILLALANEFPVDLPLGDRASSALQTITLANPLYIHIVFGIEDGLHYSNPQDLERLAHLGNLWADQQQFERAATYWEQMAQVEPGRPGGYLEAAAAFSRYRLHDEALRLLRQGREQFPAELGLYAYETGAIYEKRGDPASALAHYLQGAIAGGGDSRCQDRIVALARFPQYESLIRQSTEQLTSGQNPEIAALTLRVKLLDAEGNREELENLLLRLAEDTTSADLLATLSQIASSHRLQRVDLRARERQVLLAQSPVETFRLRLAYLRRLIDRQEVGQAERVKGDLYRENRAVFGSVRADIDENWESRNFEQAYETLLAAAKKSQHRFEERKTFDAALAAVAAGGDERARLLTETLLLEKPFDQRYLDLITDTYSREASPGGLAIFYEAKAAELQDSPLDSSEKAARFVGLHRAMIPALTNLGDYESALDHYVEWMDRTEGNADAVSEAIAFAGRHDLRRSLAERYVSNPLDSGPAHQAVAAQLEKRLEEEFSVLQEGSESGSVPRLAALLPEDLPASPSPAAKPVIQTAEARPTEPALRGGRSGPYCIQVGAFRTLDRAAQLFEEVAKLGFPARIASGEGYERVLVGDFKRASDANEMAQELEIAGYSTWVRRVPAYDRAAAATLAGADQL